MDRRSFIVTALAAIATPKKSVADSIFAKNYGWIAEDRQLTRRLYDVSNLKGFGQNKTACLWKAYTAVRGHDWIAHQQIGPDCVAHASGSCMDLLTCTRIESGKREKYINDSSTDMIYAGGRKLIAGNPRGAGMQGSWAIKYLTNYGNLLRQNYGEYDLTPYNTETLRYWSRVGIPESLQEEAKKHPLLAHIQVNTFEEVRDVISAGYPVIFCSFMGANNDKRDEDGFIKPSGKWAHAWTIAGVQDGRRPGVCLINSHGTSFGKGPKTYNQPDGSVWIDAEHIDHHLKRFNDSYAVSDYRGFIAPDRKYIFW
jgi:hypothetical protein